MNVRTLFVSVSILASAFGSFAESSAPKCEIFENGRFFIGCNYWARNAGMYMWSKWSPETIERELSELSKYGVGVMRVFPLWSDFQPLTGDCNGGGSYRSFRFRDNRPLPNPDGVDPVMIERFAWFCDCAERHGIQLIVGIVTGWMSGRQFVPEVFEEKNVLTDPVAVMWQTRFVRHFVKALRHKKAIVAWDYGNECNVMGQPASTAQFYNWMDHIAMAIRICDSSRPVVSGMHGLNTTSGGKAPIRLNGEISDILCTHPYPFYVPGCGKEAFNSFRTELHPTAESLLYRDLGGKPCFVEEIGNLGTSCNSDARSAAGMRCTMFSAWANDLKGCLWWCNSDQEGLEFPPYELTANERELGLLRQDYSPKPVMLEMQAFQNFRASLPFAQLPPRKTDAVIVVPEMTAGWIQAFGAYMLCRAAGIDPVFAGAEAELPSAPLYIVCSATSDTSYSYPAQKRIFAKARDDGATVLAIYAAANRFTFLRQQTGLEVDYCALSSCRRTFSLTSAPSRIMSCSDSGTCRLIARECEVLGSTPEGEPAFTRFPYGKGKVMLINSPVDGDFVNNVIPANPMPFHLMFREAALAAGIRHPVEKGDCPFVGLTHHPMGDGSTLVIAINFSERPVNCPISISGSLGQVFRGQVSPSAISLPPNDAAVFLVK